MDKENQDPLLSRKEAAEFLGVTSQTLAVWHSSKRYIIPIVKIGKRTVKYQRSALEDFIHLGMSGQPVSQQPKKSDMT